MAIAATAAGSGGVMAARRWVLSPPADERCVQRVIAETGGHLLEIPARLLAQRGLSEPSVMRAFMGPRQSHLHDPYLLQNMEPLVDRLARAVRRGERVVVYGDYDVDGVSASVLAARVLQTLGAEVIPFVPMRDRHGYGLSTEVLQRIRGAGISLVVSVDCGARGVEAAHASLDMGLELFVTDHHLPGVEPLPASVRMINPHAEGQAYPHRALSGTGVIFKVLQALCLRLGVDPNRVLYAHLDLVAMATICDVVSLQDPENRWLVRQGVRVARQSAAPGWRALLRAVGVDQRAITESDFGWKIGPKINSVGRLANAMLCVRLLLTTSHGEAEQLVQQVGAWDEKRRALSDRIQRDASIWLKELGTGTSRASFVHGQEEWHAGVTGIAAGKLAQSVGRPVLLLGRTGDERWKGSGRAGSINFHLEQALAECAPLLSAYGGHRAAAGFTLASKSRFAVHEFAEAFESVAGKLLPEEADREPSQRIDLEVRLPELTNDVYDQFKEFLAPFGEGNARPMFLARGVRLMKYKEVGEGGKHAKVELEQDGARLDGIGFGLAERLQGARVGQRLDVVFGWETNAFRGRVALQARLEDAAGAT